MKHRSAETPKRRLRTVRWTLGGVATVVSLVLTSLSLARDTTDYKVGVPSSGQPPVTATVAMSARPSSAAPAGTQVIYMRPWNFSELNPSLTVTERRSAQCSAPSITSDDPDSLRCSGDNVIFDPCWPSAADAAVCPDSPWTRNVTLLEPITIDPDDEDSDAEPTGPSGTPWALELTNGRHCLLVSGATGIIAGMRMNYTCDDNETVWAVGELDRSERTWRILFSSPEDTNVTFVDVVTVWV